MNSILSFEVDKLSKIQKALILTVVEKYSGNKYEVDCIKFFRKNMLIQLLEHFKESINEDGLKEINKIYKKLKIQ
jgi:uncharacterized protein YnzC (UPF0291/DUF896 family)